jgi:hypothetical protein
MEHGDGLHGVQYQVEVIVDDDVVAQLIEKEDWE